MLSWYPGPETGVSISGGDTGVASDVLGVPSGEGGVLGVPSGVT